MAAGTTDREKQLQRQWWRLQYHVRHCPGRHCTRASWERNVPAAINILMIFWTVVLGEELPEPFRRSHGEEDDSDDDEGDDDDDDEVEMAQDGDGDGGASASASTTQDVGAASWWSGCCCRRQQSAAASAPHHGDDDDDSEEPLKWCCGVW